MLWLVVCVPELVLVEPVLVEPVLVELVLVEPCGAEVELVGAAAVLGAGWPAGGLPLQAMAAAGAIAATAATAPVARTTRERLNVMRILLAGWVPKEDARRGAFVSPTR